MNKTSVSGRAVVVCGQEGQSVIEISGTLNDDVRRCLRHYFGRASLGDLVNLAKIRPNGHRMDVTSASPFVCGWVPVRWDSSEIVFDVTYQLRAQQKG